MKTPWFPPNTYPARRGLYERDWRGVDNLFAEDRAIHMDLWEPDPNPMSICYPGMWYVESKLGCNYWERAWEQNLPWRGWTEQRRAAA